MLRVVLLGVALVAVEGCSLVLETRVLVDATSPSDGGSIDGLGGDEHRDFFDTGVDRGVLQDAGDVARDRAPPPDAPDAGVVEGGAADAIAADTGTLVACATDFDCVPYFCECGTCTSSQISCVNMGQFCPLTCLQACQALTATQCACVNSVCAVAGFVTADSGTFSDSNPGFDVTIVDGPVTGLDVVGDDALISGGDVIGVCPTGQTLCATGCVDLANDPTNCGGCGIVCDAGTRCSSSRCF